MSSIKKYADVFGVDVLILMVISLCLYLDYTEGKHIWVDLLWLVIYSVYFGVIVRNYLKYQK